MRCTTNRVSINEESVSKKCHEVQLISKILPEAQKTIVLCKDCYNVFEIWEMVTVTTPINRVENLVLTGYCFPQLLWLKG